MSTPPAGLVTRRSRFSADETVGRLQDLLRERGLTVFAHIDHRENARAAGLDMPAAQVLVFGNAAAGTPLMLSAPLCALDLPLRVLVWEDAAGQAWASYHDPGALAGRYGIPADLVANISGITALVSAATAGAGPG